MYDFLEMISLSYSCFNIDWKFIDTIVRRQAGLGVWAALCSALWPSITVIHEYLWLRSQTSCSLTFFVSEHAAFWSGALDVAYALATSCEGTEKGFVGPTCVSLGSTLLP